MSINNEIAILMRELFSIYPPMVKIPLVAEILKEDVPTIRARIRRGTFQMTVREDLGIPQYVLLVDIAKFLCTGERQPQLPSRQVRLPRNPHGKNGKRHRGRPHKADQLRAQLSGGAHE